MFSVEKHPFWFDAGRDGIKYLQVDPVLFSEFLVANCRRFGFDTRTGFGLRTARFAQRRNSALQHFPRLLQRATRRSSRSTRRFRFATRRRNFATYVLLRVTMANTVIQATVVTSDRRQFFHFTALKTTRIAILIHQLLLLRTTCIDMRDHQIIRIHTSLERHHLMTNRTLIHHTLTQQHTLSNSQFTTRQDKPKYRNFWERNPHKGKQTQKWTDDAPQTKPCSYGH